MQKILSEIAGEANELQVFVDRDGFANIAANLDWIRRVDNSQSEKRRRLLAIATEAACAIAEIDAEVENAQFREQARALLVAAHGAGGKWFSFWTDGEMQISRHYCASAMRSFALVDKPDTEQIEALARVLQARKAKP